MSATPDNRLAHPEQLIVDLQHQLSECKAERDEALQRETATAEVLQIINSSHRYLTPFSKNTFGMMASHDNGRLRRVAARGYPPPSKSALKHPLETASSRLRISEIGLLPSLSRWLSTL
jgi:hypothetical protein